MNSGLRENVFLIIDMKINFFMAMATLVVSVAAVVGVKAYNYYSLSPLMKANLEALSVTEFNGVPVYQTMARCNGVMMLACTTVKYAYDCAEAYCIVNY